MRGSADQNDQTPLSHIVPREMQGPKHHSMLPTVPAPHMPPMLQGGSADVIACFCSVSISAIPDVRWTRSPGFSAITPALGR
jgi:hypothetical protein